MNDPIERITGVLRERSLSLAEQNVLISLQNLREKKGGQITKEEVGAFLQEQEDALRVMRKMIVHY